MNICRGTGNKEEPPIPFPTFLCKLLEINHFADRATPQCKEVLMQVVL